MVLLYVALWLVFDRGSFGWQGVATTATLLMTLFIQRSEHRDTQAVYAKLDELLRANGEARDHLISLDDKEPQQVEEFRSEARRSPAWVRDSLLIALADKGDGALFLTRRFRLASRCVPLPCSLLRKLFGTC